MKTGDKKKCAVIGDIDGCLSDSSIPLKFIVGQEKPDWKAFNSNLHLCTVNPWAKKLLDLLSQNTIIFIITGRCESTRDVTEQWLMDNNIRYDFLEMRPVDQHGKDSSAAVKKCIYDKKIKDNYKVLYAFDDTPSIIEMWEKENIPCIPIYNPLVFVD